VFTCKDNQKVALR